MRHLLLRLTLLGLAFLSVAIGVSAQEREPIITLRRTACFGTCPVYSVEIFEDGFIRYVGEAYVQYRGEQRAVISQDAVQNLVASFLRVHYFNLKDNYETYRDAKGRIWHVFDLPTAYTSFRIGSKKKLVKNYAFAPKELVELEAEIDRVANTKRWIGSDLLNVPSPNLEVPKPKNPSS